MGRYSKATQQQIKEELHEWKRGKLKSGKSKKTVKTGDWRAVFYPIKLDEPLVSKEVQYLPEVSESYLYAAMAKTVVRRFKNNF